MVTFRSASRVCTASSDSKWHQAKPPCVDDLSSSSPLKNSRNSSAVCNRTVLASRISLARSKSDRCISASIVEIFATNSALGIPFCSPVSRRATNAAPCAKSLGPTSILIGTPRLTWYHFLSPPACLDHRVPRARAHRHKSAPSIHVEASGSIPKSPLAALHRDRSASRPHVKGETRRQDQAIVIGMSHDECADQTVDTPQLVVQA